MSFVGLLFPSKNAAKRLSGPAQRLANILKSVLAVTEDRFEVAEPIFCPVIRNKDYFRTQELASFRMVRWRGKSSRHGVELRAWVWSANWPAGCLAEHRVLPDSWAVLECAGPANTIDRLHLDHAEIRTDNRVRWVLNATEMEAANLVELVEDLSRALRLGAGSAYRN
jgi:hypothetical protein